MNDKQFFKYIGGAMTMFIVFIIIYSIAFPSQKKHDNSKDKTQQIEKIQEKTIEQRSAREKCWRWIKENPIKTVLIVVGVPIALMITIIILGHIRLWRKGKHNTYWKNSSHLYEKIAFGFTHPIISIKNWREDKDYIKEFYYKDIQKVADNDGEHQIMDEYDADENDFVQYDSNPSNKYQGPDNAHSKHSSTSHRISNRSHRKRSSIPSANNEYKQSEDNATDNSNQRQIDEIDDNDDEIEDE